MDSRIELEQHLFDIKKRAEKAYVCTFSDFLTTSEQDFAERMGATFWGGADYCERKMAKFGEGADEFPLVILKIDVLGGKFAEKITHRDVLGAMMSLGIERCKVGDIFVDENVAFAVVHKTVAPLLLGELCQIARNNVKVETCESVPNEFEPKLVEKSFTVNSPRLDAVISGVFNLAREKASELVADGKVAVGGTVATKVAKLLAEGDVVSVRGHGKFVFAGEGGTSKKGKTYVKIALYK